jgi:hypothetical protein
MKEFYQTSEVCLLSKQLSKPMFVNRVDAEHPGRWRVDNIFVQEIGCRVPHTIAPNSNKAMGRSL